MAPCAGMSLWDDTAMDRWYTEAKKQSLREQSHIKPIPQVSFTYSKTMSGKYGLDDESTWFYDAMTANQMEAELNENRKSPVVKSVRTTPGVSAGTPDLRASLNKPLPAVPAPYFEYMFASAGLGKPNLRRGDNIDSLSSVADDNDAMVIDDTSSPSDQTPSTPQFTDTSLANIDTSAFAQQASSQAGIYVTTKELTDNSFAAAGTGLAGGALSVDEADEIEKENATLGFYGGFRVEESPGPYYAPLIGEDSGYGDVREGAEAFPEQWPIEEKQPAQVSLAEAEAMSVDMIYDSDERQRKPVRKPHSRTIPAQGMDVKAVTKLFIERRQQKAATAVTITAPPPTQESSRRVKKRNARDSFVTKSTYNSDEDEVQYLYTKKARVASIENLEVLTPPLNPPTYSLITNADENRKSNNSSKSSKFFGDSSILEPGLRGFPGQFHSVTADKTFGRSRNLTESPGNTITFGDRLHPNFLFTHHAFTPDHLYPVTEFSKLTLHKNSLMDQAIDFASHMTDQAASDSTAALRSKSQENLRREAHLECTAARLEGVSVGHYRYYQGHLNIEEYKECGMCICWDLCACNKLCTRFGDLICPCTNDIVIHKD